MDSNKPKGSVSWSTLPNSNVLGGRQRAKYAVRDEHGRFMPHEGPDFDNWQLDPEHGRKGGIVRAAMAERVSGRFQ